MAKLSDSRNSNRSDRQNKYLKPNPGGRKSGPRKLATLFQGLGLQDKTPSSFMLSPTSAKSPSANPRSGIPSTPPTPNAPARHGLRPPSRLRGAAGFSPMNAEYTRGVATLHSLLCWVY